MSATVIPLDKIIPEAQKVIRHLTRSGHKAYLVGGCVRDLLLGRAPKDFDIATDATPSDARELFQGAPMMTVHWNEYAGVYVATYAAPASGTTIVLPHTRIVEVTSPTGCTVNGDAGVISLDAGFTAGQVITYTHGFSTLPADVRLAVLEMARHLWQQSQRGPFGKQPHGAVLAGYSMPSAVTELIDPYVGLGFA